MTAGTATVEEGERTPLPIRPGDLFLCTGDRWVHRFVQIGQRARLGLARTGSRPLRKHWCSVDHVAIYVGDLTLPAWPGHLPGREHRPIPALVEALPGTIDHGPVEWANGSWPGGPTGVRVTPLADYDNRRYTHIDIDRCVAPACPGHHGGAANDRDRDQMAEYALSSLGLRYGLVWHYLGMALTTLTGGTVTLSGAQSEICSSLAAQAEVRSYHIFDRPAPCTQPADLRRHFEGPWE